jgi:hypothetical protein
MNGIANILLVAVSGIENLQHRGTIAGLGRFCDETSPVGAGRNRSERLFAWWDGILENLSTVRGSEGLDAKIAVVKRSGKER